MAPLGYPVVVGSLALRNRGALLHAAAQVVCSIAHQIRRLQRQIAVDPELLAEVATNLPVQAWAFVGLRLVRRTLLGRTIDVVARDGGVGVGDVLGLQIASEVHSVPAHSDTPLSLGAGVDAGNKGVARHHLRGLAMCPCVAVELLLITVGCDTRVAVKRGALVDVAGVRTLVLADPILRRALVLGWVGASFGQADELLVAGPGGSPHGDLDVDAVDGRIRGRCSCQPGAGDKNERADSHRLCGDGEQWNFGWHLIPEPAGLKI